MDGDTVILLLIALVSMIFRILVTPRSYTVYSGNMDVNCRVHRYLVNEMNTVVNLLTTAIFSQGIGITVSINIL